MSEQLMKEKTEGVDQELLTNLMTMVMEGHCTIEEAKAELETNPEAFIARVRKGI